jgi:hypothetical protein
MTDTQYEPAHTGLLLVDPYNDFLSEGGKVWPYVPGKPMIDESGT